MIIIWQGLGYLALLIPFAVLLLGQALTHLVLGEGYYKAHPWIAAVALLLSAVLVGLSGHMLNSGPGRLQADPVTGGDVMTRKTHSLFWIPMQWYALLIAAIAGWILFKP